LPTNPPVLAIFAQSLTFLAQMIYIYMFGAFIEKTIEYYTRTALQLHGSHDVAGRCRYKIFNRGIYKTRK